MNEKSALVLVLENVRTANTYYAAGPFHSWGLGVANPTPQFVDRRGTGHLVMCGDPQFEAGSESMACVLLRPLLLLYCLLAINASAMRLRLWDYANVDVNSSGVQRDVSRGLRDLAGSCDGSAERPPLPHLGIADLRPVKGSMERGGLCFDQSLEELLDMLNAAEYLDAIGMLDRLIDEIARAVFNDPNNFCSYAEVTEYIARSAASVGVRAPPDVVSVTADRVARMAFHNKCITSLNETNECAAQCSPGSYI